jgi:outer membrane protein, heavy metal efflux system
MQDVRRIQNRLAERLALAQQRFETARQQVETYRKDIVPRAEKTLELVRIGYEKGDAKYDYVLFLNAQRTVAQAKLAHVQALADMWRALADLAGLAQWEHW